MNTPTTVQRQCPACGDTWNELTPDPTGPTMSCGEPPCTEAVAIGNTLITHATDHALAKYTQRALPTPADGVAWRLRRMAMVEQRTRMLSLNPTLGDDSPPPYGW